MNIILSSLPDPFINGALLNATAMLYGCLMFAAILSPIFVVWTSVSAVLAASHSK